MPSNITINLDYDKTELLELFNNSEKLLLTSFDRVKADLPEGACDLPIFAKYFEMFSQFVPKHDLSLELLQIAGNVRPHINPGNNGLIIFPISGTPLTLNTYSYATPYKDKGGRPIMDAINMSPEEVSEIEATLIESIAVTQPILVDGLTTLSFRVSEEPHPLVLILKVSTLVNWFAVHNFVKRYNNDNPR